jgi:hypothetical protein
MRTALIILLSFTGSLILSGCYTFFEVPKERYFQKENHNRSKIILNNKQEIILEEEHEFSYLPDESLVIIHNDSTGTELQLSDITMVKEEHFDLGKTFLAIFWFTIAAGFLFFSVLGILGIRPSVGG